MALIAGVAMKTGVRNYRTSENIFREREKKLEQDDVMILFGLKKLLLHEHQLSCKCYLQERLPNTLFRKIPQCKFPQEKMHMIPEVKYHNNSIADLQDLSMHSCNSFPNATPKVCLKL